MSTWIQVGSTRYKGLLDNCSPGTGERAKLNTERTTETTIFRRHEPIISRPNEFGSVRHLAHDGY